MLQVFHHVYLSWKSGKFPAGIQQISEKILFTISDMFSFHNFLQMLLNMSHEILTFNPPGFYPHYP